MGVGARYKQEILGIGWCVKYEVKGMLFPGSNKSVIKSALRIVSTW